jgi:hypothetical protein
MIDVCKRKLRLPASLGYPYDITSVIDRVNDLSFTTAIGLVKWGINMSKEPKGISRFKGVNKISQKIRKWFKSIAP